MKKRLVSLVFLIVVISLISLNLVSASWQDSVSDFFKKIFIQPKISGKVVSSSDYTVKCSADYNCGPVRNIYKLCRESPSRSCTGNLTPVCYYPGTTSSYCINVSKETCVGCSFGCYGGVCNKTGAEICTNDLALYLDFENSDNDKSSYGHVASTSGAITYAAGVAGKAGYFNGASNIMFKNHSCLNFATGNFSYCAWVKIIGKVNNHPILFKKPSLGYNFFVNGYGNLQASLNDGINVYAAKSGKAPFLNDSSWHYVCAVFDRQKNLTLYVDSKLDSSAYIGGVNKSVTNLDSLYIGKNIAGNYFNGTIDELKIWRRALSLAEITSFYNLNKPGLGCVNDCNSSQKKCVGSLFYACGYYDTDSCLDWSPATSCNYGCNTGSNDYTSNCNINPQDICANECSPYAQRRCSNNYSQTCLPNVDSDSCLEWNVGAYCRYGCDSAGNCKPACTPNCTGRTCGDNGCGGSCGSCAAGSNCQAGKCVKIATCKLISANWSKEKSFSNQNVELSVYGENCDDEKLTFEVREEDLFGWNAVKIEPREAEFSGKTARTNWMAEYQDDGLLGGDPEFYFIAKINRTGQTVKSNLLSVLKRDCNSLKCSDYNRLECEQDSCAAGCFWSTQTNSCSNYPASELATITREIKLISGSLYRVNLNVSIGKSVRFKTLAIVEHIPLNAAVGFIGKGGVERDAKIEWIANEFLYLKIEDTEISYNIELDPNVENSFYGYWQSFNPKIKQRIEGDSTI